MRVLITGAAGFIGSELTRQLLAVGTLAGRDGTPQAVTELLLLDRQPVAAAVQADPRVRAVQGDLGDMALLGPLLAAGVDTVFALGASLTSEAERDIARGLEVNLLAMLRLLDLLRQQAQRPRLVYTSSIAAFGGPLPAVVGDEQALHPQTSYGTAKAMVELLLHDHSRQGLVDARCLRLPVVVMRAAQAGLAGSGSISDRIAALVREPLAGRDVVCPWSPETVVPLASVQAVARALRRIQALPAEAFGSTRTLNLPSLSLSLADWVAAGEAVAARLPGLPRRGRVLWQPDAGLQAIVDGWPRALDSATARRAGIVADDPAQAIVEAGLAAAIPLHAPMPPHTAEAAVCIIGAGSSGVAAAKALLAKGVRFEIFEKGSQLGGMWRYENDNGQSSAYRSLHIDTSRKSLQYSDFPIPAHLPDFLSHWQVAEYLEAYARHFGVLPHIRFNTAVRQVEPMADGRWQVTLHTGEQRCYRSVVVANGHLWSPRWPSFAGQFDGEQIHSHHYRTPMPYEGKHVLVVGIGNSAVDIAVDLCRSAKSVTLSTRRGAWVVPKYIMGIPTDRWSVTLGRTLRLPTPWVRRIMGRLIYLAVGNQERYGVPKPDHPIWREHACVSQDLLPYVGHGWITVRRNVKELRGREVLFDDGVQQPVDSIIHATGYKTEFPFLDPSVFEVRDNQAALYRRIVAPDRPGLFFIGLVQPIGPTVSLVEVQARWLAGVLAGDVKLPDRAAMAAEIAAHRRRQQRYVDSARYTLEVDFREHAGELRRDLAAA